MSPGGSGSPSSAGLGGLKGPIATAGTGSSSPGGAGVPEGKSSFCSAEGPLLPPEASALAGSEDGTQFLNERQDLW